MDSRHLLALCSLAVASCQTSTTSSGTHRQPAETESYALLKSRIPVLIDGETAGPGTNRQGEIRPIRVEPGQHVFEFVPKEPPGTNTAAHTRYGGRGVVAGNLQAGREYELKISSWNSGKSLELIDLDSRTVLSRAPLTLGRSTGSSQGTSNSGAGRVIGETLLEGMIHVIFW